MKFLIHFSNNHIEFKLPELHSLALLENVQISYDKLNYDIQSPFLIIEIDSVESAKKLASRSILIKDIIALWNNAPTRPELIENLKTQPELTQPVMNSSFKFVIELFNSTFTEQEKVQIINSFGFFGLKGKIQMKSPEVTFFYYEYFREAKINPELVQCYFGTHVSTGNRKLISKYDLKKREYLGITSMDAELSLIMANQALAKSGSLIIDPFVGTGSFLVTCSHFGAFTLGSDIDGRQIRGKSAYPPSLKLRKNLLSDLSINDKSLKQKNIEKVRERSFKSIAKNVQQYDLDAFVLGNIVCDAVHHPWRKVEYFDAIVSDPPYGVRAGAKKIGKNPDLEKYPLKPGADKYPQTVPYEMDEVIVDLLEFAANYLVVGGRLVYWIPTVSENYSDDDLPQHSRLRIISNSCQKFGTWERRLITMEKINNGESKKLDRDNATPAHSYFRDVYFKIKENL